MSDQKTPEEALAEIKQAAQEGKVRFASDQIVSQVDDEIQAIHFAIQLALTANPPVRPIWTSDGVEVGITLRRTEDGEYTPESLDALEKASVWLGIKLDPNEHWEHAALRLRDSRASKKEREAYS